jgi:hypothetical protein
MIRVVTVAGVALAASLCIAADSSSVSAAFGNTIVSTYPDSRTAEIWLKADGTYTGEGRRHDMSSGRWNVGGEQICFHQRRPIPFGSYCTVIPSAGMGQSWRSKAPTGEPTTVKVVSGHVSGRQVVASGS